MAINISKTETSDFTDVGNYPTDEMAEKVDEFCKALLIDSSKFTNKESSKTFYLIHDYIKKYNRILYSPISNMCYQCFQEYEKGNGPDLFGSFISNIEKVSNYSGTKAYKDKLMKAKLNNDEDEVKYLIDTAKAVIKIWDHANLAQQQYNVLKLTDEEYRKKIDEFVAPIKSSINKDLEHVSMKMEDISQRFDAVSINMDSISGEMDSISDEMDIVSNEIEDLSKGMSAQLLSIVGIFTALAFLIFGGISSLDNLFSEMNDLPVYKLVILGCVWGLGIINMIFVFLFCIGKMTKLQFKSTEKQDASIIERYPVVWFGNLVLVTILLFFALFYYMDMCDLETWFVKWCRENAVLFTVIAFILIIAFFCTLSYVIFKKKK